MILSLGVFLSYFDDKVEASGFKWNKWMIDNIFNPKKDDGNKKDEIEIPEDLKKKWRDEYNLHKKNY